VGDGRQKELTEIAGLEIDGPRLCQCSRDWIAALRQLKSFVTCRKRS